MIHVLNLFLDYPSVPSERVVVSKEQSAGWYRLSAYYLAKMAGELPLILVHPIFFITVVYWSVGLNGVAAFFATIGTAFLDNIAGQVIILSINKNKKISSLNYFL